MKYKISFLLLMLSFVFTNTYAAEKKENRKIAGSFKSWGVMCAESSDGWEMASRELNGMLRARQIIGTAGTTYPMTTMGSISTPVLGLREKAEKPFSVCVTVSE
ncbi:MAG: hypothetical protein A2Z91_09115 [Deltaproteobacteria bacterium GWA2_38_16]|nr:MAG: hypothetical protein A2Z91_09115 [Deltaproteobacteria bacterium GWA2_38_16]OGQ02542.1 MAG: hypothetical protein A3D19_09615 [Deltaproteobacteria bacterium RIFCSPHIGHO2_02_FULL_38_15]OGQ34130.1 MAG: hypothetical protein A3A72_04020 [Deltaproteobacteria bacterium RIFCSPLOWO2_01_FULL_38_9]OGQ60370.1 MAG: hypothetical protein A3G92_03265 [Deltaproteobacteria bacterium RIFCSPLOWO2_12_FULL_38_8]HBQ21003.1 hypothetical protein [Deltaproteobacteria bacterium]